MSRYPESLSSRSVAAKSMARLDPFVMAWLVDEFPVLYLDIFERPVDGLSSQRVASRLSGIV